MLNLHHRSPELNRKFGHSEARVNCLQRHRAIASDRVGLGIAIMI